MNTSSLIQPLPRKLSLPERQQEFIPIDEKPDYLNQVWVALRRHKMVALAIVAIGMALTFAIVSVVRPVYSATAAIMIDSRGAQIANVGNIGGGLTVDLDTVTNEVQVITSRNLVAMVVRDLDLEQDPHYDPNRIGPLRSLAHSWLSIDRWWMPAALIEPLRSAIEKPVLKGREKTDAVIDAVENGLSVGPVGRSRAISITFGSVDPLIAQKVANALAQRYLDNQTSMKRTASELAYGRITEELSGLRESAGDAARQVEDFRAKSGLIDGRETTLIRQQISEVSTQLTAAELDRLSISTRLNEVERAAARSGGDNSAEVQKSPLIQQLRLQQFQITRDASQAQAVYGDRYPGAQAVANQLAILQRRIDQEVQRILAGLRGDLQASVDKADGLRAQLDHLKTEMTKLRGSEVTLNQLAQNAQATREIYDAFLRRAKETGVSGAIQSPDAYIISLAALPTSSASPDFKIALLVGAVMSMALALAVVLALEARDLGFQSQLQVSRVLGLSTIAMIPKLHRRDKVPDPRSLVGTAINDLYMRVVLAPENKCVLVTSAFPKEGKTTISLALARVAADNGKKTLFIDADMRRLHDRTRLSRTATPGLSELLAGSVDLEEMISRDRIVSDLSVLNAGAPVENPYRLICSTNMRDLLKQARRTFDLVIIDSPPILVGPDAWILALFADTTLLFVRWAQTPCKGVLTAYLKMLEAGAKIFGVVLTMVDAKRVSRSEGMDAIQYSKLMGGYYVPEYHE